jgi:hypothetical protein
MLAEQEELKSESTAPEQSAGELTGRVVASVMRLLGRPQGRHRVDVHPLWENRYRVNVLVSERSTYAELAHSFFIVADAAGNVLVSTPPITRQY